MMRRPAQRAFTLIETMVAVTILMVAIVGPLYEATRAYTNSLIASDQMIAASLAQEAAEHVIGIRDDNYLYTLANPSAPHTWLYGLDSCHPGPCYIDATQASPNDVLANSGVLYLSASALYTQISTGNTPTRFTRVVRITDITGSPNEVKVTVTVTWSTSHQPQTTTVVSYLDNWL